MSELVVERCDPRERAAEILDLFARNGQPEFRAAFDRAYRARADRGMRSWVGMVGPDATMHVSVSPVTIRSGSRTLTGGVMGDLMVAGDQRDFWAPLRLLRTVVADLKRDGSVDFLLTTTTADAESVFRGAGFKDYGSLRRLVLPLYAPYLALARARGRARRLHARELDAAPARGSVPLSSGTYWRPVATPEYYRTRVQRAEYFDASWLEMRRKDGGAAGYALLSRHAREPEVELADAFWDEPGASLGAVAHAAARVARRRGFRKLVLTTLAESGATRELVRAGFLERAFRSVLLVQRLRDAPPAEDFLLTGFALSSW